MAKYELMVVLESTVADEEEVSGAAFGDRAVRSQHHRKGLWIEGAGLEIGQDVVHLVVDLPLRIDAFGRSAADG